MQTTTQDDTDQRPLVVRILVKRFLLRHPVAWGGGYATAGVVHVLLGVILTAYRYWWGTGLIGIGALELWVANQLLRTPAEPRQQRP